METEPTAPKLQQGSANSEEALEPKVADESKQQPKKEEQGRKPKESYDDYIKNLPPPFWESKKPPPFSETKGAPPRKQEDRSAEEIAASIKAVCAPVTAADREADKRRKSRSLRERWKEWRSETKSADPDVRDLRPMETGSSARLNVYGSVLTDRKVKK